MRIVVTLLLCLLGTAGVMGQNPVANFTASVTSGCGPLSVTFTDQSTGAPKFWNWDFGNGNLSNLQNPTIVYSTPGVYTVKLVVRNNTGADGITKTNYIVVNPSPTPYFTSDKQLACAPSNIQFIDGSVANAGTIVQWAWNFGDGGTATTQNPVHQYTATGFYDVSLTVTSSTGCKATSAQGRFIRIVPGVKADFNFTAPSTCKAPFDVTFSNQTSGPGNLSYAWDLGNSVTSTQVNPNTTYAAAGTFTVKLTAQSDFGCQNTIQKNISVSGSTTSFNSPVTVCLGSPAAFQNTSSPAAISSLWDFGDGSQSTSTNPSKTYAAPGIYTVKLYSTFSKCVDSVFKTITVQTKPVVDFTAPKRASCKAPLTVNFQDLSPDAVAWQWDFGDGGTSTQKNPAYTYNTMGVFNVTLTITDSKGCQNTANRGSYIRIEAPQIDVKNVPDGGCVPYAFTPIPNSQAVDGVASWLWDFGDGSPASTLPNPTHIYSSTGTYALKVTITTVDGCTATTTIPNAIKVGTPITPSFTKSADPSCYSSPVTFTNTTVGGDGYYWMFGDGDSSLLKDPPPHRYLDTGRFDVTLIVYNNGCPDTLTQPSFVHILPPVARFSNLVDCPNNKLTVLFTNLSKVDAGYGAISYSWDFGDGSPVSTLANPSHTYPLPFNTEYIVRLTTTNGACSDTYVKAIRTMNEPADFTLSVDSACKNTPVTFTAINSIPQNVKLYTWLINGVPVIATRTYDHSFANTGTYNIQLVITDNNNCITNGPVKQLVITGPQAAFTVLNNGGCKNGITQFNDASFSTRPIIRWEWGFGDGGTSVLKDPTHVYTDTGSYRVSIKVWDDRGCDNNYADIIRVTKPTAYFGADTTLFCPGGQLRFKDSSFTNIAGWNWNFGDGGSSNIQNPSHVYSGGDSVYTVKLAVTDIFGCQDSVTRTNFVTIKKPKPAFDIKDTVSICPPLETKFTFKGKDYQDFYWEFGDGGISSLPNPSHFYNTYGSFTAKLYIVGYGGCLDSASSIVNVYNPDATTQLTYSPINACNELTVNFNVITTPSTPYILDLDDGSFDSSYRKSFQHLYSTFGFRAPSVYLMDSVNGCVVRVGGASGTIRILGSEPIFALDTKRFCDSGTVNFTNFSVGNDPIATSTWNFGDGTTINAQDASHFYNRPGTYIVSHTDVTQAGCTKTLTDTVRVFATPKPFITNNNIICSQSDINFLANLVVPDTAISWKWDFGNGKTDSAVNPTTSYSAAGNYTVRLTATNLLGCKDTTSKVVTVKPLPAITISGDTSFIVGGGITIPLTYSSNVTSYNWTPGTDLTCTTCPNPYANPKFTTTYKVTVTDSNNCVSSRNVTLISLCNNKNFFIPNTFSPNGDSFNDAFFPRGTGIFRIQAMRIFNRWGELILERKNFAANDEGAGWDGKYKGKPAEVDTYVYFVDIICENGVVITYKGNVTLIR